MTLAIVNKFNLELCQTDVKPAFLNGRLNVPVFMQIPEGIECSIEIKRLKVCMLEKALCDLKMSLKCWKQCLKPDF